MKVFSFIHLAPLAAAFVVPNQHTFQELSIESDTSTRLERLKLDLDHAAHCVKSKLGLAKHAVQSSLDNALAFSHDFVTPLATEAFDGRAWLENNVEHLNWLTDDDHKPPHDGPPHHGPPHDGPPHHGPPHHGPPHHGPPHHPHDKPNQTVYQLISESKYTTKLAKLINDYPDLVEALNGTKANYTVFAPTDKAFEKIPDHAHKPSKEQLKKLLSYHVVDDFYPAARVLVTHTVPTLLQGEDLSEDKVAQRLSFNIGLRGLTVNFYSRIIAVNIFGTNGVIHGVDSIILPPPSALKIVELVPSEFSTLELGLTKTGLLDELTAPHKGGTLFAPSNFAFTKLGPRINAFLFSKYGQKYLKALLQYHVVPSVTLYSDAVYNYDGDGEDKSDGRTPKGYYHFDLPTMLEDRTLNVDVVRYGGLISIKVNGFARVTVQDGVARDGVIQVVGDVLVPPKKFPSGESNAQVSETEMTLEDFKERLEPYIQ